MTVSNPTDTRRGNRILGALRKAMAVFLVMLAAVLALSFSAADEAEAKTYTGTWNPQIVNGGWVNITLNITFTINYNPGDPYMTVKVTDNGTIFGTSQWHNGDSFRDGFSLARPTTSRPTPPYDVPGRPTYGRDSNSYAISTLTQWGNSNGNVCLLYAFQSNSNDSYHGVGGELAGGEIEYTYDLSSYKVGESPILFYFGNRWQGGTYGTNVTLDSVMTTASVGMDVKIAPKVTSSSSTGGSITPAGTISYPYGGNSSTYTWTRNYGYALKNVIIDGVSYGDAKSSHYFAGMTSDHSIKVEWQELGDISLSKMTASSLLSCTDRYSLEDAQYILYTDSGCTDKAKDVEGKNIILTTDSSGKATTSKSIYPGTYYLKESVASKGFRLDPTVHTVTVEAGKTSSVTSEEEPQRGYITVQKSSSAPELTDGNGCYTLEGAVYDVYRDGVVVATLTTDDDGTTETFTAPLGDYTVSESTPSMGFRTDKETYSVNIASDEQSKTFRSTEVPLVDVYPLALHKMDREAEDTGHADTPQGGLTLEGAEYRVTYYDGYYSSVLQTAPLASKWQKTFKTSYDASTRAIFEVLSDEMFNDGTGQMGWLLGTYVVEETRAPHGYALDDRGPYIMQITKATAETAESDIVSAGHTRTDSGTDTRITKENAMVSSESALRSNLMIMIFGESTTDEDHTSSMKDGLEGVRFDIINENPYDVYCFERDAWVKPGEIVLTLTSNEEGYCNTDETAMEGGKGQYLPMGEYRVHPVEESIPEGYKQVEDYVLDVTAPYKTYKWVVEDKIGSALRIEKVDADTGKLIRGFASFELYNLDTGEQVEHRIDYPSRDIISVFTTDVAGKATLPNKLMPGNYIIREIKAPSGYDLAEDVENDIPFTVNGDTVSTYDDPIVVRFEDHATKANLRVSVKDNDSKAYITGSPSRVSVYAREDVVTADGTVRFAKGQLAFEGDTAEGKGFVDITNLYPGKYEVIQQDAPEGYLINPNGFSISLDYVNDTTPVKGNVEIPNIAQRSDIIVSLVQEDSGSQIRVPGGTFDVIADEDIVTPDGTIRHRKGDIVDQIVTDGTGTGMPGDPQYPGKYVLIQTDSPEGYVPDETPRSITVASGDDKEPQGPATLVEHSNPAQCGVITLDKKDSESAKNVLVPGAVFAIYANEDILTGDGATQFRKGEEVSRMMTRSDGKATSGYLNAGSYKVVEAKAPEGYMNDKGAESVVSIPYEDGKPYSETAGASISFMNQAALGKAEITKVDSQTKKPLREEGIEIDVIAAEDIVTPDGTVRHLQGDLIQSALTDERGTATFENLYIGKYAAVQKSPVTGYDINDEPVPFEVEYANDEEPPKTVKREIEDDVLRGSIEIRKVVSGTDQPLRSSSATFKLCADEDIVTADGTVHARQGEEIATVETDENGIARIDGLCSGRYRVTETKAPECYVMDSTEYAIDARYNLAIDENGERTYDLLETLSIGNSIQKSSIVIENNDKETGSPIKAPATFEIRADEDILTPEGETVYRKGDIVATIDTEDGSAVADDIPVGQYEVIMVKPSDGYPLDEEARHVETAYAPEAGVDGVPVTVEYLSEMPTARIDIAKLDALDEETLLEGAAFALTPIDDITRGDGSLILRAGDVADEQTTGEDGKAAFEKVRQGRYMLEETEAPAGYALCDGQEIVVAYKHGETEILIASESDAPEEGMLDEDADGGDEDADSIEAGDGVEEDASEPEATDESADMFAISLEVLDAPMTASITKVGPMGGHIADCELELYMYKGKASDWDDGAQNVEAARDKLTLIDKWTTIDKAQGKEEHAIGAANGKGDARDGNGDGAREEALSTFEGTAHIVYPLEAGTYVLVEAKAAQGYDIARPMTFEVESGQARYEIEMLDHYANVADELIEGNPVPLAMLAAKEMISEYGDLAWMLIAILSVASGAMVGIARHRRKAR